jgi:hypothetical protein
MTAAEPVAFDVIPPTVGVDLRWAGMFYEPEGGGDWAKPKGGLYLSTFISTDQETGEVGTAYRVVDTHHGRPEWHTIPMGEVDWTVYTGLLRVDVVRSTITTIMRDAERHPKNRDHHVGSIVRLQSALS